MHLVVGHESFLAREAVLKALNEDIEIEIHPHLREAFSHVDADAVAYFLLLCLQ